MFFIVPEDDPPAPPAENTPGAAPAATGKPPSVKVELDLDDAPFLEEPPAEEKKPEAPPPEQTAKVSPAPDKKPPLKERLLVRLRPLLSNKKRLLIAGAALLVLVAGGVAVPFLLSSPSAPKPAEPAKPQTRRIVVNGTQDDHEPAPAGPQILFSFEPFIVPLRGPENELRFLRCRFAVPLDNPMLKAEMELKKIALRNAMYYYLHNREVPFLLDPRESGVIKADLIGVINGLVSTEKIHELYFEDFQVIAP